MAIWVDADACPRVIREILYRAAERCQVALTLVANQTIEIPRSRHVRMLTVSAGFDVADNEIARRVEAGYEFRRVDQDLLKAMYLDLDVKLMILQYGGNVLPNLKDAEEAAQYGRMRLNLLTVKPGITGLWQTSGRSDLSYDERVQLDMYYIRNYSIWLDLQILFIQTLPAVLHKRGAY